MNYKSVLVILLGFIAYKILYKPKPSLSPIVNTKLGQISGIVDFSRDGREFFSYLGIPFAKPPVGNLRFEAPEKVDGWSGVLNAHEYGSPCAQTQALFGALEGEENCLFLNVHKPNITSNGDKLLPTMVFIYGGAFLEGKSQMYQPDYFMDEDVILVTFNYRLAALGFLSTGDGLIRGNMGLKDQSMALRWVKENIESFGGDPQKITVFGESAGGISVHLHMLSQMSEGLFQRAISQSGTALSSWVFTKNPQAQAKRFATQLNCPTKNNKEMVDCLKKAPLKNILDIHLEGRDPLKESITFYSPTIEVVNDKNAFITKEPIELIKEKKNIVPWLTGVNSQEGILLFACKLNLST